MSILKIFDQNGGNPGFSTTDHAEISQNLNKIGVRFERWTAEKALSDSASQDEILAAYHTAVDKLKKEYGFQSADVVSLTPDHPDKKAFREKFLSEHTHSDFEVRFFVDGSGLFYIHKDNSVYTILCEKGDLISVPANVTHWFDMGANPFFKCIRLFTTPEGWVANFTGSDISTKHPDYEKFMSLAK